MTSLQVIEENKLLWDEIQRLPEEYFSSCALKFFGLEGIKKVYYNLLKQEDTGPCGIEYWLTK